MKRWINAGAREGICYVVTNGDENFAVVNREHADALAAKLNAMEKAELARASLEAVVDALVETVDSWNDAAADEDRGRSNDMIHLTLCDDGSGYLGRRRPSFHGPDGKAVDDIEDWHEFRDLGELIEVLRSEGVEVQG